MDKIKRLWPLAVGAIVLLVLFEWRPWHVFSSSENTAPVAEAVVSEGPSLEIAKQDIRAQLSAVTYNSVSSELSARIQELPFKEGQAFKVGQVLVVFDCATQQAQYQKTKAVLSIAKETMTPIKNYWLLDQLVVLNMKTPIQNTSRPKLKMMSWPQFSHAATSWPPIAV